MLKLKLQYFSHLMWRADSFEKTLMLGKIEGRRRRGQQRMRWLDGITDLMDMNLGKLGVSDGQGGLACCSPWGHKELDTTEWLNWTEITILLIWSSVYSTQYFFCWKVCVLCVYVVVCECDWILTNILFPLLDQKLSSMQNSYLMYPLLPILMPSTLWRHLMNAW